ncbi:MAG: hypothetical protein IJK87_07430 [Prevotella sp.]|nr:hypothetical protein [Prevotella sp.]
MTITGWEKPRPNYGGWARSRHPPVVQKAWTGCPKGLDGSSKIVGRL